MFRLLILSFLPLFLFANPTERTLALIKPEAVASNHIGEIISFYEAAGLKVVGLKMIFPTKEQVQQFYIEHQSRPFYNDLTSYMSSGPSIALVLQGDGAVSKNRQVMGPTDPKEALPNTIRAKFGTSRQQNAVHGSDSATSALREIKFFFNEQDLLN